MPTNYGDDPAPPRYFLVKREEPKRERESQEKIVKAKPDLDWRQFVLILMRALVPFPEARDAVRAAFWAAGAEASP